MYVVWRKARKSDGLKIGRSKIEDRECDISFTDLRGRKMSWHKLEIIKCHGVIDFNTESNN